MVTHPGLLMMETVLEGLSLSESAWEESLEVASLVLSD